MANGGFLVSVPRYTLNFVVNNVFIVAIKEVLSSQENSIDNAHYANVHLTTLLVLNEASVRVISGIFTYLWSSDSDFFDGVISVSRKNQIRYAGNKELFGSFEKRLFASFYCIFIFWYIKISGFRGNHPVNTDRRSFSLPVGLYVFALAVAIKADRQVKQIKGIATIGGKNLLSW